MKLYIKQKVFSWKDKFSVYDENQQIYFNVEGRVLSLGKKLTVYDYSGIVGFIGQRLLHWMPTYEVFLGEEAIKADQDIDSANSLAIVKKEFTFFYPKYSIMPSSDMGANQYQFPWRMEGDFWDHDYQIFDSYGNVVVTVSKAWLTWGDFYEVNISRDDLVLPATMMVLCIDAAIASQNNG